MKAIFAGTALSFALAVPGAAFGQMDQSATRSSVNADLQQWQAAGYRVSGAETTYPAEVQAAERHLPMPARDQLRVADTGSGAAGPAGGNTRAEAAGFAATRGDTSGYGVQAGGTTESGAREPRGPASLYFGP
jgi:hypothetical protein